MALLALYEGAAVRVEAMRSFLSPLVTVGKRG